MGKPSFLAPKISSNSAMRVSRSAGSSESIRSQTRAFTSEVVKLVVSFEVVSCLVSCFAVFDGWGIDLPRGYFLDLK